MKFVCVTDDPAARLPYTSRLERKDAAVGAAPRHEGPHPGNPDSASPQAALWRGPLSGLARRRREQILYLVVGGWNTLFGYGVWAVLEYLLHSHLHYLVIVVLSWPLSVGNAYIGYRTIVFRSKGRVLRELPRFSLVYVVTLVSTLVALPILLHALPFSIYVIQAGFTAAVVAVSYLGHKFFSFRTTVKGSAATVDTAPDAHTRRPALSPKGG